MKRVSGEQALWGLVWGGTGLFVVWPVLEVLVQSVIRNGAFSLAAWTSLLGSQGGLLVNSLLVAGFVVLITLPIAMAMALWLVRGRCDSLRNRAVRMTLLLTLISPPFVGAMAFIMLFGRRGLVTWKLLGLDWNPYGLHGVVIMESFSLVALAAMLLCVTLRGVDCTLENASRDLGMSPGKTLLHVTLPLCMPGILATALLVFVRALSDFATPLFVGGSFQVLSSRAYTTLIHMGDFQLAGAMNVLLLVPALLGVWAMRRLGSGQVFSLRLADEAPGFQLPEVLAAITGAVTLCWVAAQWLLYGLVLLGAFTRTWGVDFTLTLNHLIALFDFRLSSVWRSLACSLAAAAGGCSLGALVAWLLRNTAPARRQWVESLLDIPYMLPGTFFGLGYLLVYARLPFEVSAAVLIALNCLFRQLSPALRASMAGLSRVNPELESAVRDMGAGALSHFRDVALPALRPSALFAFVNAFSASMVSTGPIIFLVTPYAKVMSVDMFESINSGKFGAANAMAAALILLVLIVNVLAGRVNGRGEKLYDARI